MPSGPIAKTRTATKIVTRIVERTRTCTVTQEPEDVCSIDKKCGQIKTCAEAFYRMAVCRHYELDGNPLPDAPPKAGQPNGIPSATQCSKTVTDMRAPIKAQPFTPPTRTVTTCALFSA